MSALSAGIHTIDAAAYHADPCEAPSLSASIAHLLLSSSPLHAWTAHPRLNPGHAHVAEDRFDVGTAAHALLLQGEQIMHVVDAADWRSKAAKEVRDLARANGLIPLLTDQADRVKELCGAVHRQLSELAIEPPLLTAGQPEQTLVWEERGVTCRARADWLHSDHSAIDDLKTTGRTANPLTWSRQSLWSIGADIQAAFYLRGLQALTGRKAEFRWCVAETAPPYAVSVISLAPDALTLADAKIDRALETFAWCLNEDRWPGYPPRVCSVETPVWEEQRWWEREQLQEAPA